MSRISDKFVELGKKRQSALVAYVMAGFPSDKATRAAVSGLIRGGADIIELGFPFSDPLADGPVIQNASNIALQKGASIERFFEMVRKIRKNTDIPLILMTYSNILYHMGYLEFISKAVDAGIDGFILPDMPVEEAAEYKRAARGKAETIFLTSPNTSKARIKNIAGAS
ncbi:MAG: tryptophan synthase subunit alpha, partial [Nitrosopumilus sp. B06]